MPKVPRSQQHCEPTLDSPQRSRGPCVSVPALVLYDRTTVLLSAACTLPKGAAIYPPLAAKREMPS